MSPGIKEVKKIRKISWWKVILGSILVVAALGALYLYSQNLNYLIGFGAILAGAPGGILLWLGLKKSGESGFEFTSKQGPEYSGKENAIIIYAIRDPLTGKDIPDRIEFKEIDEPLPGSRPHYLRNLGKHFYEYMNLPGDGDKLVPVNLPDKRLCTPEAFTIPSNMQPYKDYMEYNPPSNMQKIASGILLLAMVIVGILMVMTGGSPPS